MKQSKKRNRLFPNIAITLVLVLLCSMVLQLTPVRTVNAASAKATSADILAPTASNKKGIQGTEFKYSEAADSDPASLGISHVLFNIDLAQVINTDGTGQAFDYKGKTYHFNYENYIKIFEWRARELKAQGQAVTFVLLLSWSDDPVIQNLIYPSARKQASDIYYYALNVDDAEAKAHLEATFHYLTNIFSYSDCFVQNWIIGNEVNVPIQYNYSGTYDAATNIDLCVKSFDLLYEALQTNSPYAKAYISMTHHWTSNNGGTAIPTKDFITQFAARESGKNWNVAFHAYPPIMAEQVWSKTSAMYLSHSEGTPYVCGVNLEVLTDYIKKNYGDSHRVILSEQSFDSKHGNDEQAAMIAYTYYAGVRNDMVDAVIFTTWQDSNLAVFDGYKLGVIDENGNQKPAYNVFKYMNTTQAAAYTDSYLNNLSAWTGRSITSWEDNILYQPASTDALLTNASLYLPPHLQTEEKIMIGMTTTPSSDALDIDFRWTVKDCDSGSIVHSTDWILNNEWLEYFPTKASKYLITCEARVSGNTASQMSDYKEVYFGITEEEYDKTHEFVPINPNTTVETAGLYVAELDRNKVLVGHTVNSSNPDSLQYRWTAYNKTTDETIVMQDWKDDDRWVTWYPDSFGEYVITGYARSTDNTANVVSSVTEAFEFNPYIKGKCQMPYYGEGGGYLIGVESYENPNQSYSYEMLILDCTLLAEGKDAWVYTTGQYKVSEGNAGWCIWQPQYGYYWTLFRVYDANGVMIDQACYGFQNI